MSDHPILFSAPMVRAILTGSKTQTRRIVKPQPPHSCRYEINGARSHALCFGPPTSEHSLGPCVPPTGTSADHRLACPYGAPGDVLWVRELGWYDKTFGRWFFDDGWCVSSDGRIGAQAPGLPSPERFRACGFKRTPSIHMPRWASRLTLRVLDVRVQRLQEISEQDARAEGVEPLESSEHEERDPRCFDRSLCENCGGHRLYEAGSLAGACPDTDRKQCDSHVKRFRALWDSINDKRAPWSSNPWVWAVTFERVESASLAKLEQTR